MDTPEVRMAAAANRRTLAFEFDRIMRVREALEAAGLCGSADAAKGNGREAALAVIEALDRLGVVVHVPRPPEPHIPPPTLGERIEGGLLTLGRRATGAASRRLPLARLRARIPFRRQP